MTRTSFAALDGPPRDARLASPPFGGIAELAQYQQFVTWRSEARPGSAKPAKVPYDPKTGQRASVSDPTTWGSYAQVRLACLQHGHDGVGFVLTEGDPFWGGDIDHCRDPETGQITPEAEAAVLLCDTYTEVSPSGTGLRVIGRGVLPPGPRKNGGFERYDDKRFVTITSNHLPGTPTNIADCSNRMAAIHSAFTAFGEQAKRQSNRRYTAADLENADSPAPAVDIADDDLPQRMFASRSGNEIKALWRGNWQEKYGSQNEADLAMCSHLAFWTGRNPARMDGLMRESGLMRAKWDESHYADGSTYGEATIAKAMETVHATYRRDGRGLVSITATASFTGDSEEAADTLSQLFDMLAVAHLSSTQKLVGIALACHFAVRGGNRTSVSLSEIGASIGVSDDTVSRCITKYEQRGFLAKGLQSRPVGRPDGDTGGWIPSFERRLYVSPRIPARSVAAYLAQLAVLSPLPDAKRHGGVREHKDSGPG